MTKEPLIRKIDYEDAVDILIEAMGEAIGIDLRHEMPPLHDELIAKYVEKLKAVSMVE